MGVLNTRLITIVGTMSVLDGSVIVESLICFRYFVLFCLFLFVD